MSYNLVMVNPRNQAIAVELRRVAGELEMQQANPFRVRAYRQAARLIERLAEDAGELSRRGELIKIKGIGKDLAQKVALFCETGRMEAGSLTSQPVPVEYASWLTLPGFNPALVRYLSERLHIQTLDDLEALVRSRLLRTLPDVTVGDDQILEGIARLRAGLPPP
jgi:DNA polymerase (family 10)